MSHNVIIEYSARRRLVPIIAREQKKHHQRKEVLQRIRTHYAEAVALLGKMETTLGFDGLMCQKMEAGSSRLQAGGRRDGEFD